MKLYCFQDEFDNANKNSSKLSNIYFFTLEKLKQDMLDNELSEIKVVEVTVTNKFKATLKSELVLTKTNQKQKK